MNSAKPPLPTSSIFDLRKKVLQVLERSINSTDKIVA